MVVIVGVGVFVGVVLIDTVTDGVGVADDGIVGVLVAVQIGRAHV